MIYRPFLLHPRLDPSMEDDPDIRTFAKIAHETFCIFNMPDTLTLRVTNKKATLGECFWDLQIIDITCFAISRRDKFTFALQLLKHELAHAIQEREGSPVGHNARFRRICHIIGCRYNRAGIELPRWVEKRLGKS